MFDGRAPELASLDVYTGTDFGPPLEVEADGTGLLFIEGAAFTEGEATMSLLVDDVLVARSVVQGVWGALYAHYLYRTEPGRQHKVTMSIDGSWQENSPRLRVSSEPVVGEQRLVPGGGWSTPQIAPR
jgi:hypothetical protein